MVVRVGAIHIIAVNELSIGPEQKAVGALEHCAEALLIRACRQVLQGACRVRAWDISGRHFQDKALWSCVVVTSGNSITTCVTITISAHPIRARDLLRTRLLDKVLWASHCDTLVFLATAPVIVSVCAILVVAQQVSGIIPELVSWWAIEHGAPPFLNSASDQIFLEGASSILTPDMSSIWLRSISDRW